MTYRAQSLTRVPSFLMTGSWIGPYSLSQSCSQLCDANSGSSTMHRRIFTESEIKLLARNAEDLLLLHQCFLDELEATARFLGIPVDPGNSVPSSVSLAQVDAAVGAITRIFVQQVSHSDLYCTTLAQASKGIPFSCLSRFLRWTFGSIGDNQN